MRLGLKISLINMYACISIRNTRMIPCKNNTNSDDGHARDKRREGGGELGHHWHGAWIPKIEDHRSWMQKFCIPKS